MTHEEEAMLKSLTRLWYALGRMPGTASLDVMAADGKVRAAGRRANAKSGSTLDLVGVVDALADYAEAASDSLREIFAAHEAEHDELARVRRFRNDLRWALGLDA